jgi:hypothetical protein
MLGGASGVSRALVIGLVMLAVATAIAACGDAGGADPRTVATPTAARAPPSATETDRTRARNALIRLADMPHEWSEQAGNVTRLDCGRFHPFAGSTAIVRSPRLTLEHTGVQERIVLFRSDAAARRALRRLDSRRAAACLRRELRRHVSAEAEAPAGPAELARAERLGPAANARRYVSSSVGPFGKVVGQIDAVHERVGRAVVALVLVSSFDPLDEAVYEHVVTVVSRRAHRAVD